MVLYGPFSTVDEIFSKSVSTLRHFLKTYFLFILDILKIQRKVKFMSLKISYNNISFSSLEYGPKSDKSASAFLKFCFHLC